MERKLESFWLWIWVMGCTTKSGWEFDTKEEAELYFNRYFREGSINHEITKEVSND